MEEWKAFSTCVNTEELYICGTCALAHSFSIDSYTAREQPHDYMSVFFIVDTLGSNKRKLAVVGKEHLIAESNIASLPVNYYCNNGQINSHAIISHLKEWDIELATKQKTVLLLLNMPACGHLANFKFNKIKIINTNMEFLSNTLDHIIECFKYHYRKLQITRKIEQGDLYVGHLEYINMIGLAWFSVPDSNIKQCFYPSKEGSLHLKANVCDVNHSLLRWCQMHNVPLNLQLYGHHLDELIHCDKELKSIDLEDTTEAFQLIRKPQSASSMEAYQAMKRLLSYVQSKSASDYVVNSVKHLENHLEYGALSEIHQIIASSKTE